MTMIQTVPTDDSESSLSLQRIVRRQVARAQKVHEDELKWKCEAIIDAAKSYATEETRTSTVLETITPDYIKSVTENAFEGHEYLLFKTGFRIITSAVKISYTDPDSKLSNQEIHLHMNKSWRDFRKQHARIIWTEAVLRRKDGILMWDFVGFYGLPDEIRDRPELILSEF